MYSVYVYSVFGYILPLHTIGQTLPIIIELERDISEKESIIWMKIKSNLLPVTCLGSVKSYE